jgi:hypothetical protein
MEDTDEFQAHDPDERHREEQRAVSEGGGGEAEGFELAEEELIEHASHGDSGPDPSNLAGNPEGFRGDEGSEADHEHSSEVEGGEEGDEGER